MTGKVAKCKKGKTGLILGIRKRYICGHPATKGGKAIYQGICLDKGRIGQQWQSLDPEFIGTLDDWVKLRYKELANDNL
jgi:hypothetical protein